MNNDCLGMIIHACVAIGEFDIFADTIVIKWEMLSNGRHAVSFSQLVSRMVKDDGTRASSLLVRVLFEKSHQAEVKTYRNLQKSVTDSIASRRFLLLCKALSFLRNRGYSTKEFEVKVTFLDGSSRKRYVVGFMPYPFEVDNDIFVIFDERGNIVDS
jgi:hypothetical protein